MISKGCPQAASLFSWKKTSEMKQREKVILAYVSQYHEKYYFNHDIGKLPETIEKEILQDLIFMTEEAGGVAELGFNEWGEVYLDSYCEEGDLGYDQVAGRLLTSEIERKNRDLFKEMEEWYALINR